MPIQPPGELVHDWNAALAPAQVPGRIELLDETFRDGLQNPSVRDPSVDDKLQVLHLMDQVGIDLATIGLPASSQRAFDDCLRLCRAVAAERLTLRVACSARTIPADITPIIELSQRSGIAVEVYAFVGSSPIRALAEDWDLDQIKRYSARALDLAVRAGLRATYVTEDTSRSRPEVLAELYKLAVDHGASRLCLCDTVGHATPEGTRRLVRFTRNVLDSLGADTGLDWHGHNDRGLALINALTALEEGATRLHGTALGIGERVGNAAMELIILNLRLLGLVDGHDPTKLIDYCHAVARALGWSIPINYPLVGRDAFRTGTGVHAAAIMKAQAKGSAWLADRVYSGVPAGMFGRRQEICVGYMSGASNVVYWLDSRGVPKDSALIASIVERAKSSHRILTDEELWSLVEDYRSLVLEAGAQAT
ncbi:MAG TPA: LeuA family protein [Polyangiaceae bacterium]|jgi:2-isopropylmalate synthase